ncbi:MAG: hypothetical protein QOF39_1128 [Frankiales bacterium]|nr:hypothetical protein [Frankiales bacterium]
MLRARGLAVLALSAMLHVPAVPAVPAAPSAPPAAGSAPATAAAGPPAPGQTRSHYLTSVDPGLLSRTGAADAVDAVGQGLAQALVVLDAGSPAGEDGSVRLPDTHRHAEPSAVQAAAVAYGKAWRAAKGPALMLVVGTTNYGSFTGGPHGAAWARMVESVAGALPGIDVRAGLDAEQEYSTPLATRSWVEAYDASGTRPYVDFGSCTCPPAPSPPANHWTTEDVYAVAVGDGRAVVLPEIYAPKGGNARAWGRVVAWSRTQHPELPVRIVGALTEAGACNGPPKRSCTGIDLTPGPAWAQLTTVLGLGSDPGPDLRYLTDISYLPVAPARHHARIGAPLLIALMMLVGALVSTAVLAFVRLGPPRRRHRRH